MITLGTLDFMKVLYLNSRGDGLSGNTKMPVINAASICFRTAADAKMMNASG